MIHKIQLAQLVLIKNHKSIKEAHVIPGDIPETGRAQNDFRPLMFLQAQQIQYSVFCNICVDFITVSYRSPLILQI